MITSYVVEIDGEDVGIITRDSNRPLFRFFSANDRFRSLHTAEFTGYRDAERAARALAVRHRKRLNATESFSRPIEQASPERAPHS